MPDRLSYAVNGSTRRPDIAQLHRDLDDFPERGKYRVYSKSWDPIGWADEPQYRGQQPCRFPPHWSPMTCFLVGVDRVEAYFAGKAAL